MNTILISGTAKCIDNYVVYDIIIWASQTGEALQFITQKAIAAYGYGELWNEVKLIVEQYFNNPKFQDGAYTQFLDHLIKKGTGTQHFHIKNKN